jgi:hypothetical protein
LIKYGTQASCSKSEKAFPMHTTEHFNHIKRTDPSSRVQWRKTTLRKIEAAVPQGIVLGPVLYIFYTSDFLTSDNTTATFANDTAILTTYDDPALASVKLQATISKIEDWAKKWRIK